MRIIWGSIKRDFWFPLVSLEPSIAEPCEDITPFPDLCHFWKAMLVYWQITSLDFSGQSTHFRGLEGLVPPSWFVVPLFRFGQSWERIMSCGSHLAMDVNRKPPEEGWWT